MIICLLIPLGAASASDVNNTDDQVLSATPNTDTLSAGVNLEQENDTLSVQENENLLSAGQDSGSNNLLGEESNDVGSYNDLSELIKLSEGSLILQKDYKYTTGDSTPIQIDKEITIDGNNRTIDGNNKNLFMITAKNVKITNLNIVNCDTPINWNGDNGKIENVSFQKITTNSITWNGINGIIKNVTFKNFSNNIVISASGSNITFDHVTFDYISSNQLMDIYSLYPKFHNLTIMNSSCSFDAGFYLRTTTTFAEFTDCKFIDITSTSTFMRTQRIDANFTRCTFDNVVAGSLGLVTSHMGEVSLMNSTVMNCKKSNKDYDLFGLTGYNEGSNGYPSVLHIKNCKFINNIGNVDFALLKLDYESSVDNSSFDNNAPIYITSQGVSITNSDFNKSTIIIKNNGGMNGEFATIDHCNFSNMDYAISIYANKSTISNSNFTDITNYAIYFAQNGLSCNGINTNKYSNVGHENNTNLGTFVSYPVIYVSPSGESIDNDSTHFWTTFEDAISKIDYRGTIYLSDGTYDLGESTVNINSNLIGLNYGRVIITNSSFNFNPWYSIVKNITFVNTTKSFSLNMFSEMDYCDFINASGFILASEPRSLKLTNINIINATSSAGILSLANFGRFLFNHLENITLTNYTGYIMYDVEDAISNSFINITVKNSPKFAFAKSRTGNTGDAIWLISNNVYSDIKVLNSNVVKLFDLIHSRVKYFAQDEFNVFTLEDISLSDTSLMTLNSAVLKNISLINLTSTSTNLNIFDFRDSVTQFSNVTFKDTEGEFNLVKSTKSINVENMTVSNVTINYLFDFSNSFDISILKIDNSEFTALTKNFEPVNIKSFNFIKSNVTNDVIFNLSGYSSVSNSNFNNYTGHIIVNGDKVSFTNTSFIQGNNPSLNGSAVEVVNGNYISFTDCNFTDNNGLNGAVYIFEGSLRPAFIDCNFTDNIAEEVAGAIYFKYNAGEGSVVTFGGITERTVAGVNGEKLNGVYGNLTQAVGIVYVINDTDGKSGAEANAKTPETPGTFDVAYGIAGKNCVFVFVRGGDIFNYTNSALKGQLMESLDEGWTFQGNNTTIENLRFHITHGNLKAYNITFKGNDAGSVVIVDDENVLFDNCTFINNGGESVEYGGAIQINANNTNITNCTFKDNVALNSTSGFGGALYVNASYVVISNNTFDHNSAYNTGSHIYITENNKNITVNNNTFKKSYRSGSGFGSGIVIQGNNINVVDNIFESNTGLTGSALSLIGSVNNININNNVFENNTADANGGVYLSYTNGLDTVINVNNNTFKNNSAVNGGALYIDSLTRQDLLSLEDNSYSNNSAVKGGAIFINMPSFTLKDIKVLTNNTAVNGGAVYINADNVVLRNINFTNNNASLGGALYVAGNNTWVYESSFIGNTANSTNNDRGSAIYIASDLLFHMRNGQLDNNYVYGGNNSKLYYGDISFVNVNPDVVGTFLSSNPYQQYISNSSKFTYSFAFITSGDDKGLGFSADTATTLDKVLDTGVENNAVLYIVDREYMLKGELINSLQKLNVTVIGVNNTSIKRATSNTNKYLFNHPKKIKNLSLNNYLSTKTQKNKN